MQGRGSCRDKPGEHGTHPTAPRANCLLGDLPFDIGARLRATLESVPLVKGVTLCNVGDTLRHVYFPTSGLVSVMALTSMGGTVELAAVSREGLVGWPVLLEAQITPYQAVVRLTGTALRLNVTTLRSYVLKDEGLRSTLLAYAHRVSSEMAQAVVCQCYHTLLQRLCRWLLTASDSTQMETLELTHESLAAALGVIRTGVTKAALELEDADAIRTRHGRITIRNRGLLLRTTCECYEAMRTGRLALRSNGAAASH